MKPHARPLLRSVAAYTLAAAFASTATAQSNPSTPATTAAANDGIPRTLYAVGYAHLDTQWRWTYPLVIREFVKNTLVDNFALIEKYPHYVFNFSGSRRYEMMKEYYPAEYEQLKKHIADGRWFVCGSCVDEADALVPSGESQVRHVLYGNQFSRREFGKESQESMLPDCFGFSAALPTILAHTGLRGFSTQKLSWGSAIGIPFKVGVWNGVDGNGVLAAFDPGAYTGSVREDLSQSKTWLNRINKTGERSGAYVDYHYFGTGDKGGAPAAESVEWVEKSVNGSGPLKVHSGTAEQMFVDITDAQRAKLPVHQGELLLTEHSAGSATSQAYMKRWNRKSELLADGAERASVAAAWLGGLAYPRERLYNAWDLVLGSQMHDMLPGTSLPKAYEYCWNDYLIAQNQFADVETGAVATIASKLDTRVADGATPLVIYNPLSIDRTDAVEATVTLPEGAKSVRIVGADGQPVASQVLSIDGNRAKVVFVAKVPSVGFAVYGVTAGDAQDAAELKVSERTLENARYRVTLNDAGDIASIFDKQANRETLREPARLALVYHRPREYPAWNMDWTDAKEPPRGYVDGPATFKVVENGPARIALEVTRKSNGSTFVQRIQLASGTAGDRVDVVNTIDWQTGERALKAVFPLAAANPQAAYDVQVGAVTRGNNDPKKYEVPQQQWIDLTDASGEFGAAILNDSKFASDKPDDHTLRLTLLYTPGVRGVYQDQSTQDFGRHQITYSIAPHAGDHNAGDVSWRARRLNQPLRAYATAAHAGALGKSFSLLGVDSPQVEVQAIKQAEEGDGVVVRLKEMTGKATAKDATITAAVPIASAVEVDGQERKIGDAKLEGGKLVAGFGPYRLRSFAVKFAAPAEPAAPAQSQAVALTYDVDAVSTNANRADGKFDGAGRTFAAEQFPKTLDSAGVRFEFGKTDDGAKNAVVARGQTIAIPAGYDRVYVIAAAANGDREATFKIGDKTVRETVQDWGGYVGQWDNRLWNEPIPELAFSVSAKMTGLVPGYVKTNTIASFASHRHNQSNADEAYEYTYLYRYGFDVPAGATSITLPDDAKIGVFAVSVAKGTPAGTTPAAPLYDTLEEHHGNAASLPTIEAADAAFDDGTSVAIGHGLYWDQSNVRYTLDGSEPKADSPVVADGTVYVARSGTLKVRQFDAAGKGGAVVERQLRIDDRKPPQLAAATAASTLPLVTLAFSEPLAPQSATNADSYKIDGATVRQATLSPDGRTVTLTLDQPLAGGDAKVRLNGITDGSDRANRASSDPVAIRVSRPLVTIESFKGPAEPIERRVEGLPTGKAAAWSMTAFVRLDRQPDPLTAIAGFGRAVDGKAGFGRYLARFDDGLRFWSVQRDVTGGNEGQFRLKRWQMIAATYDGKTLRLYKDGVPVGSREVQLADDDESIVRVAPPSPWGDRGHRFEGELSDFNVWDAPLSADALRQIAADGLAKRNPTGG